MDVQRSSIDGRTGQRKGRIWSKPGGLLEVWQKQTQDLRMLLVQHQKGNHPTPSSVEGNSHNLGEEEAFEGTQDTAHKITTENSGGGDNGYRHRGTAVGRL